MKLAMIGLGRMGANLTRRLMRGDHECVVYDLHRDAVYHLEREGAIGAETLEDLAANLPSPRVVWVMVPAALTDSVIDDLTGVLEEGDIVIDGGNGYYRDDIARAERLGPRGIKYVDIGTSGGVFGLNRGFCLMIGGDRATVEYLRPSSPPWHPVSNLLHPLVGAPMSLPMPNKDSSTADLLEPATSSKWFTTASSTE
jgi:6-phosphogluconate dehydrogenase